MNPERKIFLGKTSIHHSMLFSDILCHQYFSVQRKTDFFRPLLKKCKLIEVMKMGFAHTGGSDTFTWLGDADACGSSFGTFHKIDVNSIPFLQISSNKTTLKIIY